ncbi:hypothetical protein HDU67_006238 [Dinochytrium kinnereticum]|nr:hypothetical protein HDU67_006238 [Dinochytrium kinnereticum]
MPTVAGPFPPPDKLKPALPLPPPSAPTAMHLPPRGIETFFGFISTPLDALYVVQACKVGQLKALHERPKSHDRNSVRSGSIIVFDERWDEMDAIENQRAISYLQGD